MGTPGTPYTACIDFEQVGGWVESGVTKYATAYPSASTCAEAGFTRIDDVEDCRRAVDFYGYASMTDGSNFMNEYQYTLGCGIFSSPISSGLATTAYTLFWADDNAEDCTKTNINAHTPRNAACICCETYDTITPVTYQACTCPSPSPPAEPPASPPPPPSNPPLCPVVDATCTDHANDQAAATAACAGDPLCFVTSTLDNDAGSNCGVYALVGTPNQNALNAGRTVDEGPGATCEDQGMTSLDSAAACKAYADNTAGVSWGASVAFTTASKGGPHCFIYWSPSGTNSANGKAYYNRGVSHTCDSTGLDVSAGCVCCAGDRYRYESCICPSPPPPPTSPPPVQTIHQVPRHTCGGTIQAPHNNAADAHADCLSHGCTGLANLSFINSPHYMYAGNHGANAGVTTDTRSFCSASWYINDLTVLGTDSHVMAFYMHDLGSLAPGGPCGNVGWNAWSGSTAAAACVGCDPNMDKCPSPPPASPPPGTPLLLPDPPATGANVVVTLEPASPPPATPPSPPSPPSPPTPPLTPVAEPASSLGSVGLISGGLIGLFSMLALFLGGCCAPAAAAGASWKRRERDKDRKEDLQLLKLPS